MKVTKRMILALWMAFFCLGPHSVHGQPPEETPSPSGQVVIVPSGRPINIGIGTLLSGQDAPIGMDVLKGAMAYVQDHPRLMGHPLVLLPKDTQCNPKVALSKARLFCQSQPKPAAVIGYLCSPSTLAALELHRECHLPLVNVSSSDPRVTSNPQDWVVRLWSSRANEAYIVARWSRTMGYRRLGVIYEADPVSLSVKEAFKGILKRVNRKAKVHYVRSGSHSEIEEGLNVSGRPLQLIYYIGETVDVGKLWSSLPQRLRDRRWVIDGRVYLPPSNRGAGDVVPKQLFRVAMFLPTGDPQSPPFRFFTKRFGEPSVYTLAAYDAVAVISEALTKVASDGPSGTKWSPQGLMGAIREIKMQGLTGTIQFDDHGDLRPVRGKIERFTPKGWKTYWRPRTR